MKLEINNVIYSLVIDFTDEILGEVSHFIYSDNGEIKNQFFVRKYQGDEVVYIMLDEEENKLVEKKYFGGRG